ncbi:sigma 54-interacting transcriptional regulator [Geomonas sp. Red69]|uniref:sigma 54-interacting transcriptional regulator n=1 Tax=Geomonas diazotrophica TaxID=2843197 RepID=UPI001C114F44|nr:sigma 54-interacting transcriptional regulator [Geomonas diazotrophica]MBU5635198.1 sigma 54-interacting transcriptional regulator [Geomonas diazotrophica]
MNTSLNPAELIGFSSSGELRSDDFYQAMVNAVDVGILAVNTSGMIILANRAVRESFGAFQGVHLNDVLPDLWPKVAQRLLGHTRNTEISVRGIESNFLVRVSPMLLDQEQVGAVCVFVESTELEEMAKQMEFFQGLTRELDTIIDSSSDGLWICDADANVVRINPASERINNVQAKDVVGRNMRDLINARVFDRSATLEVIRTRARVNLLQQREGRKLITTATPVFDSADRITRVVVSERDITEIDNLQRELEDQEAIKDQFRNQMLEMQQEQQLENQQIIARSPAMLKALRQALKVAKVESTVLILGPSGVGKGLFADLIHKNSERANKPLIKINCGAIPESLIESELFGYDKGAFTGAQSGGKPGYFELADGGILFLDEIAELPLPSQVKLLRFMEDGTIMRLGSTRPREVKVRILAATHRNLEQMVEEGKFRLDLYYRLKVIPIHVPSLKERKECLLPLILHYIEWYAKKHKTGKRLSRAACDTLLGYPFPGNVRELMNLCERLVVMTETEVISLQDLPADVAKGDTSETAAPAQWPESMTLPQVIESTERALLAHALKSHGCQADLAEALGVSQPTIARKLKRYGLAC